MARSPLAHAFVIASMAVLLSLIGTTVAVAAEDASAPPGPIDITAEPPFVIFSTVPPKPPAISDYPLPDGSDEYWDLWDPDAAWVDAAEHVDLMAIGAWMVRYYASDRDLKRMIDWLADHDIPMGMELEPLEWPGPEVCDHTESFEGPYDLEAVQKIADLGGHLDLIVLDEPFVNAVKLQGPRACGYSVEQAVDEIGAYRDKLRAIHPGVRIASIEPVLSEPAIDGADMATWLDTYEQRTGEPFAYLAMDVDWRIPDWPERVIEIEAVADGRGVPFGMLYLGSETESDNDRWLQQAAEHYARFEVASGGTPDVVGIYSWHEQPDRLLPDDDVGTQTGLINRYFGTRTRLDELAIASKGRAISGRLTDIEGEPWSGRDLEVRATPLGGAKQRHTISGTVPEAAQEAIIAVRGNVEGGKPSRLNVELSKIDYREVGRRGNQVPNGDLRRGLERWGPYGTGSVTIRGRSMRLRATPLQPVFVDGTPFKVTPGAEFEFSATIDVAAPSIGSGYVSVIFLGDDEIRRVPLPFAPRAVDLGTVTTDEDGRYRVPLADLPRGRHRVEVSYAGDIEDWPAQVSTIVTRR